MTPFSQFLPATRIHWSARFIAIVVIPTAIGFAQPAAPFNPKAVWASFWHGGNIDLMYAATVMNDGSFILAGESGSSSLPNAVAAVGKPVAAKSGGPDGMVARFNPDYSLAWYTYIGGAGNDVINSVVVDGDNVYVLGTTNSNEIPTNAGGDGFPITGAVPQKSRVNGYEQFVGCLNGKTGKLLWLSYKGGPGSDHGNRLSVRSVRLGSVTARLIAGVGDSNGDFPTSPAVSSPCGTQQIVPFQQGAQGAVDATVFLWTETSDTNGIPNGATENWSTYLGGSGNDVASTCAIGSQGELFVAGWTETPGPGQVASGQNPFPATGSPGVITNNFNVTTGQAEDGFAAKFSPAGCLMAAGFLGGDRNDRVENGGIDSQDNFYLVGRTLSDNFSGTSLLPPGTGQRDRGGDPPLQTGGSDAFMAVLDKNAVLQRATYFGGAGDEFGKSCSVVDIGGRTVIFMSGETRGNNSPVSPQCGSSALPFRATRGGSDSPANTTSDQMIAAFTPECCRLWGSYYGGTANDDATCIAAAAVNGSIRIVLAGETSSNDYPVISPAGAFNQKTMSAVSAVASGILGIVVDGPASAPTPSSPGTVRFDAPFPNPVSDRVTLRFVLPAPGDVTIELFGDDGRSVASPIGRHIMAPGEHAEQIGTEGLAPGIYTARITCEGSVGIEKFVVVR